MFLLMRWTGPRPPHTARQSVHQGTNSREHRSHEDDVNGSPLGFRSEQPAQLCVAAPDRGSGGDGALIKGGIENAIC